MELTLDQALQKGIEAHKAGQFQEADRIYTAILKVQPKHPDANHNMGVLAMGVGKTQEAIPFFKIALKVNPNITQFWLSYIDALIKLDRLHDAKALVDQAKEKGLKGVAFAKIEEKFADSLETFTFNLEKKLLVSAVELREAGDFAEAIKLLENALSQVPRNANLFALLSHCYLLKEDLEKSTLYLGKAKAIDPTNALVFWNEIRILITNGKKSDALNLARTAIKKFPDNAEGLVIVGSCLRINDKIEESIAYLDRAIELKPNYAEAFINRGLARLLQADDRSALYDLEKAYKLKPHVRQIWSILANLKLKLEQYNEAIPFLNEMIKTDPLNERYFANLALCYQNLNQPVATMENYKKALSLKPNFEEALSNMGNALTQQGQWEEAIEAYNKALAIKPDLYGVHSNIGNALHENGELEAALEAYQTSISMHPEDLTAWNNLRFPLQGIKRLISSEEELASYFPEHDGSQHAQISTSILNYKLSTGSEQIEAHLNDTLALLSNAENTIIERPKGNRSSAKVEITPPDDIVALVHFGRSGTGLLHSLIDGHPEVSTLPSIYFSEYFDNATWHKIISGGWNEMADRFQSTYEVLFDASSLQPIASKSGKLLHDMGKKEGMINVGDQRDEILSVDKGLFCSELNRLIDLYDKLDALDFFKLVNVAYNKALNDFNQKKLIFYHIHNPDTHAQLNFVRLAPKAKWIVMVRDPLQSLESWITEPYNENDYSDITYRIWEILFELDNIIYRRQASVGLRLEDLKGNPRKTISALCDWMGIEEADSLYEMTAQGKKWWGDPTSIDYAKDGMDPFGKTSIRRSVGAIFSEKDQFILQTLFYPFSARFGYIEENQKQFKTDLKAVRPMLDQMFDFEKTIVEQTNSDPEKFMKSGPYLYLRSGLIERWETLNKYGTYPNMITPLEVNSQN